jgi:guanylate kinase
VIISGPSGVGKDTIIDAMQRREPPHPRHYVITVTTRGIREREIDGVSYHFLSLDDYQRLDTAGGLLEASEVHGNCYGTPRDQVQSALSSGRDAILKIDVQGADKVREIVPDALLIFVVPPSLKALDARLVGRSTETPRDLEIRRSNAAIELSRMDEYDHVVINETDEVDRTAEQIDAIIAAEHDLYPARGPPRQYVVAVPPEVEVADLGTPGLDLYPHLVHREVVIIADTVRSDGNPGEMRLYRREEILQHSPQARVSPHDPGLKETLLSLEFAGQMPREVILIGVIPASTDSTIGLSPEVESALTNAGAAAANELGRVGFEITRRDQPLPMDLWWERMAGDEVAGQ